MAGRTTEEIQASFVVISFLQVSTVEQVAIMQLQMTIPGRLIFYANAMAINMKHILN